MLPAGEIPAPERGTSRPTGNRALGSWRQRHELSVGTSDERAVTQVSAPGDRQGVCGESPLR